MNDPESMIHARLSGGKEVPCYACNCMECNNEFFVPGYSEEWMPSYCPFCGVKFIRKETDGTAAPFTPKPL